MSKFSPDLVGKVFDSDQKEVILNLHCDLAEQMGKKIKDGTEEAVASALKAKGIDAELFGLTDAEKAYVKLNKTVQKTKEIWDRNGYMPGVNERITFQDLAKKDMQRKIEWEKNGRMIDSVFSTDQPLMIPRVIQQIVRDVIEPALVLTPLFDNVNVSSAGTVITMPAVGNAMVAADIPEGGEYPEQSLEFAGEITAKIGKSGIACKVTEETIRYNLFDMMSLQFKAAGRALMRHKEQKIANLIFNNGTTFFDNTVTGKHTAGRGQDGSGNDTLTLDDILLMFADLSNAGFTPDTMIVHPYAWFGMAREPVMRALFMTGFGGGQYYQSYQGSVGKAESFAAGGLNNSTKPTDPQQLATTYTVPGILPVPMSIIVTPFQQASASAHTSTITLCQRSELGILLTDETVTTDEFNDVLRDIYKVKFRERYGLVLKNNASAIRHAKNVNWFNKGYAFDDLLTWQAGSGILPSISTGAIDIVG